MAQSARTQVLDLFAGIGGFSYGFHESDFRVIGVDADELVTSTFERNEIGEAVKEDLRKEMYRRRAKVVIGSPPCRPWSLVNVTRRRSAHPDRALVGRFFKHVQEIRPRLVLMENVVPLKHDGTYVWWTNTLERHGYDIGAQIVRYSDFGAATSRHRLLTVGVRGYEGGAGLFLALLESRKKSAATVHDAIEWLRDIPWEGVPDHVWGRHNTIERYRYYYETGKYGWYQLKYNEPAPSFGNVLKTYTLHPDAWTNGAPPRVVSVREVLCIMGFPRSFSFPDDMPLTKKYQAVADTVSPAFSRACASAARELLHLIG
jgi:DNA (cytosine-5)-methyltransferase 1